MVQSHSSDRLNYYDSEVKNQARKGSMADACFF